MDKESSQTPDLKLCFWNQPITRMVRIVRPDKQCSNFVTLTSVFSSSLDFIGVLIIGLSGVCAAVHIKGCSGNMDDHQKLRAQRDIGITVYRLEVEIKGFAL
jgi:hypothetical protein